MFDVIKKKRRKKKGVYWVNRMQLTQFVSLALFFVSFSSFFFRGRWGGGGGGRER